MKTKHLVQRFLDTDPLEILTNTVSIFPPQVPYNSLHPKALISVFKDLLILDNRDYYLTTNTFSMYGLRGFTRKETL